MKRFLLVALMVLCFVPVVHSALITDTYQFTVNNSLLSGGPWGSISLNQDAALNANRVDFVVDPYSSAFDGIASNFGLQVFALNSNAGGTLNIVLPDSWGASFVQNVSDYGTFSIRNSGTGSTRQDPLSFYITSTQVISLANFEIANAAGYLYAGHIAGITVNGNTQITSAWFATPGASIPEPGTMMLLGSGLVGLAGWGRKKFRK